MAYLCWCAVKQSINQSINRSILAIAYSPVCRPYLIIVYVTNNCVLYRTHLVLTHSVCTIPKRLVKYISNYLTTRTLLSSLSRSNHDDTITPCDAIESTDSEPEASGDVWGREWRDVLPGSLLGEQQRFVAKKRCNGECTLAELGKTDG